jgi:alanine racemase
MKRLIRAVVDAAALRHNLERARTVASDARIMAVIKANAYGHGLVHAARALAAADGFAVARLDEGLALRAAGLSNRVLLLEGVFSAEQLTLAAREDFELMVHSFEQLELLDSLAGSAEVKAGSSSIPA